MNIIDTALEVAVKKLKSNLKSSVSIETITLLFNVSLLRAIEQMKERGDHRGDQFHMSQSADGYFEYVLGIETSNIGVYTCRWLEERRDYDYAKAVTDYFFDGLMHEENYVEDRFSFLAMELPDYYISRNDLPDYDDEYIAGLLKKAIEIEGAWRWRYVSKKKAKEIAVFLASY